MFNFIHLCISKSTDYVIASKRPNDFDKNRRYFSLTLQSRADRQSLLHDLVGLRFAGWLCHPLAVSCMIPPVDSVIAEECMSNALTPRLGNVMHHFHSNSVDENLATGHTYWQGKLGNIVSVG